MQMLQPQVTKLTQKKRMNQNLAVCGFHFN